jgi:hypothetical protein
MRINQIYNSESTFSKHTEDLILLADKISFFEYISLGPDSDIAIYITPIKDMRSIKTSSIEDETIRRVYLKQKMIPGDIGVIRTQSKICLASLCVSAKKKILRFIEGK